MTAYREKYKDHRIGILDKIKPLQSDLILCLPMFSKDVNTSAILRSAHIFGVRKIYLAGNEDIISRQTSGTSHWLDYKRVNTYEELFDLLPEEHPIIVADSHGATLIYDFQWPTNPILFLGRENGIPKIVLKNVNDHYQIKIPQFGLCESLNVGVAAGIMLFHHRMQFDKSAVPIQ